MLEPLFNEIKSLKAWNFIKKRLQRKCFPVKFRKFLRTPFFIEHIRCLLLEGVCEGTSFVKILQSCHFNIFGITCFREMSIKGTVMQTGKALKNDRLRVSKASWKFRIPTIYNFAVIYEWNLLFSWKIVFFLTVPIVFSVYKQNFMTQ